MILHDNIFKKFIETNYPIKRINAKNNLRTRFKRAIYLGDKGFHILNDENKSLIINHIKKDILFLLDEDFDGFDSKILYYLNY